MINIFWFRRDLRMEDNHALFEAMQDGLPVLPVFIFDENILSDLEKDDPRVSFIYNCLKEINNNLKKISSGVRIYRGKPTKIWQEILTTYSVNAVYINNDYEPYALERDHEIQTLLLQASIPMYRYKDQVIFEESEIVKTDGKPYTVFTPYKLRWLEKFDPKKDLDDYSITSGNFLRFENSFPPLESLGLLPSSIKVMPFDLSVITEYAHDRDIPYKDSTSYIGPHLRFGTVSIRSIIRKVNGQSDTYLSELIWREFFMQILFHFPDVVQQNFHRKYDGIHWRNNEEEFRLWCEGKTGYPMVDAGIRQLNATGYMHNRVRMVCASFLCKHLLIDWRWGEAYFAEKLLDYELSSNNGNWQWAAGTGCDAAPYFRVFNPTEQQKKFDPDFNYIHKWIPELDSFDYPSPIVEHKFARKRALSTYKLGIQ